MWLDQAKPREILFWLSGPNVKDASVEILP